MYKSFNVVIATAGRPSLQTMVHSIAPQLSEHDYLTILWDCEPFEFQVNSDCQVIEKVNPEPLGFWGHGSRNKWIPELPGDYVLNGDDDDVYLPGAIAKMREVCTKEKLYVFKFEHGGTVVPMYKEIKIGNIGTSCGVYPNIPDMPLWAPFYGGDGKFYEDLAKILPVEFVDHIIYKVTPRETVNVIPDQPENIACSCGNHGFISYNKILNIWEGYCNRCDRITR